MALNRHIGLILAVLALASCAPRQRPTAAPQVPAPSVSAPSPPATVRTPLPAPSCGIERWAVKTGADVDVVHVDRQAVATTIDALASIRRPARLPEGSRVSQAERTLYSVNATLVAYAREEDSDYHLVLQDVNGHTMIAEIPLPACMGAGSPFIEPVTNARREFDAKLRATTRFKVAAIPVRVTGIGFFDFSHRQRGLAPNAIELHPVVDIEFTAQPGAQVDKG